MIIPKKSKLHNFIIVHNKPKSFIFIKNLCAFVEKCIKFTKVPSKVSGNLMFLYHKVSIKGNFLAENKHW